MNSQQTLNMLLPSGVTHQVTPFLGSHSTLVINKNHSHYYAPTNN